MEERTPVQRDTGDAMRVSRCRVSRCSLFRGVRGVRRLPPRVDRLSHMWLLPIRYGLILADHVRLASAVNAAAMGAEDLVYFPGSSGTVTSA